MAKAVVVNYTAEQTAQVVADYSAGVSVETIAENMGKTARSIIAKLSREGVYVAKSKAKGVAAPRKAELITEIATAIGTSEELIESLEKATREALELIAKAVKA